MVVAAVGQEPVGLLPGAAAFAGDRPGMQVIKQWDELRDVVAIAAGQGDGQRDPGRVDEKVVF